MMTGIIFLLFVPAAGRADEETARQLVAEGRNFLTQHDIVNANDRFRNAVSQDYDNQTAQAFYSVTRILNLIYGEEFNDLLDRNNASSWGRNVYDWDVEFPENEDGNTNLPEGAPTSTEYVDFLTTYLIPEVNEALQNLAHVDSSFSVILTPAETDSNDALEVDYGDVLMYRALLHALKTCIKITAAYNVEFNVADLLPRVEDGSISINDDLLNVYADFLKLLTPNQMSAAGADLELSIDSYLAASAFIRAEEDDQGDDLIAFDSESLADEQKYRHMMEDVKASLAGPATVGDEELSDPFVLDLSGFFDQPFGLRSLLPVFDDDNNVIPCTFPDPTINGVLPFYTSGKWNDLLGLSVSVAGEIASSLGVQGIIHVESFEEHWGNEFYVLQDSTTLSSVGAYLLKVKTGSTVWLRAWSDEDGNGIISPGDRIGEAASPIEVATGSCAYQDQVDINLDQEVTGIMGRIVDLYGQPLAGIYVEARVSDEPRGCSYLGRWTVTNGEGRFALNGITAGTQVVISVSALSNGYMDGMWTGSGMTSNCSDAAVYTSTGAGGEDVQITLSRASSVWGNVLDEWGNPLAWASVEVYDAQNFTWLGSGSSREDGFYRVFFRHAPSGSIKMRAVGPYGVNVLPEYYQDKPDYNQADALDAPVECSLSSITFWLDAGGRITGNVYYSDGFPVAGAVVTVYDSSDNYVSQGSADSNGYYEVGKLVTGEYLLDFKRYTSTGDITYQKTDSVSVTAGEDTNGTDFYFPTTLSDINGDGNFDESDMQMFAGAMGTNCCAQEGDFDHDSDVDGLDIYWMARSLN